MDIKKISPVNNNDVKKARKPEGERNIEMKTVAVSTQEATGNYGRALINLNGVSFGAQKAAVPGENSPKIVVRDLSDEEFEEYKTKITEKIKALPEEVQKSVNIDSANKTNIFLLDKITSDERLYLNENLMQNLGYILSDTHSNENTESKIRILNKATEDLRFNQNHYLMQGLANIVYSTNYSDNADIKIKFIDFLLDDKRISENEGLMQKAGDIIWGLSQENQTNAKIDLIKTIFQDEKLSKNENLLQNCGEIVRSTNSKEQAEAEIMLLKTISGNESLYDVLQNDIAKLVANTDKPELAEAGKDFLEKTINNEKLSNNENLMQNLADITLQVTSNEQKILKERMLQILTENEPFTKNTAVTQKAGDIVLNLNNKRSASSVLKLLKAVASDEELSSNKGLLDNIGKMVGLITYPGEEEKFLKLLPEIKKGEITANQIIALTDEQNEISYESVKKLNRTIGTQKASQLSQNDTIIAANFIDIYNKQNINEIPRDAKRELLRNLVASNADLFGQSETIKNMFPMLPKNQEEYCSLLPALVRSTGIETNTFEQSSVEEFNSDMTALSSTLAKISDDEFNALDFHQEYDKGDFIKDTLDLVKVLDKNERQKVYDYFGFELHHNKNAEFKTEDGTGFSLTGYPVNLNNGKKLTQIEDEKTKEVIEKLRPLVVKFSENNHVTSGNEEIDGEVNKILEVLPELRGAIGRNQHGTQDFGVFKHSLKVMQKIAQNPKFEELNESDKKIMLLGSLLHDISKTEGTVDRAHAEKGSFDAYFISKKFNLSQNEQIKLYTLIKNHEWLGFVNTAKDEKTLTQRLQSVSYDLRHDNLFDMSLIFTHADLKAIKKDDSFHDIKDGKGRTNFKGEVRSFGEAADFYGEKIKENIQELQKSQPLLPVTKFPKAGTIDRAITTVNDDGSTNIKGVYKDKKGLTIIKFNEVEDWEAIGFPKGTVSHGIKTTTDANEEVDTGNIHFLVHGLDYSNQLAKFDAFSLADSDALLSVSYAERPESKYRFFRPQGVILDCDTKYVHGGGNTDTGSGCEKNIAEFKKNYAFDGYRHSDRVYISELIKEALNIDDEEYINFVKENENKAFSEIDPEELRNKVIKAFAQINSNTRKGNREYNEMYVSNTKPPMAVFAYNMNKNETIGNPIEFLNKTETDEKRFGNSNGEEISVKERTEFLQKYALEHDLPFVVFGD